jgi:hypothetical protein
MYPVRTATPTTTSTSTITITTTITTTTTTTTRIFVVGDRRLGRLSRLVCRDLLLGVLHECIFHRGVLDP